MDRKKFLQFSTLSLFTSFLNKKSYPIQNQPSNEDREYFEIRKYQIQSGEKSKRFDNYVKEILIPAYNKKGISPIGVFRPFYGSNGQTIYLLIPYKNFELFLNIQENGLSIDDKISEIIDFTQSISDPLYLGINNSLLKAFVGMPNLKIPEMSKKKKSRIFELRIYQSPSKKDCKKKIDMFNNGNLISILNRTGMRPVFFGETLVGENLPNLAYMLAFRDIVELDTLWKKYWFDEKRKKIFNQLEYQNIVSNRRAIVLRPKSYSQI